MILSAVLGSAPARAASVPLSISISGNHFVNGAGQTIRLLGVNHASSEYACVDGYAYNDGHQDDADAAAIASWGANAVRVPLNEDCWLGINGQPNSSQGATPPLTQAGYQQAVEQYVAALNRHGLYAILDLHWSAPGTIVADGQDPMPDDHSATFWASVATAFAGNPAVVFDIFNEPFSPADPRSGNDPRYPVSWSCWENGGCTVPHYDQSATETTQLYQAVGMQALVTAIRNAGAKQPIMTGGLDYANDLTQWLNNAPDDPLKQEAASFHNYQGKSCDNAACWNSTIAAVAANVPVVTGEFDEDDFANASCANKTPSTFDTDYMNWADQHGVSYLAWGWEVLSAQEISGQGCSAYFLTSDPGGTPAPPNGTAVHDHLLALLANPPSGGGGTSGGGGGTSGGGGGTSGGGHSITLKLLRAAVRSGGSTVAFVLRAAQSCRGTLTGRTKSAYAVSAGKHRRHRISLGTVRFRLSAGKAKTVVLALSRASRKLLASRQSLRVTITITLRSGTTRSVTHRTITLRLPARHTH